MSRRMTLPGADELFRTTGAGALGDPDLTVPGAEPLRAVTQDADNTVEGMADARVAGVRHTTARRRNRQVGDRRPSGRERHDEKITVYVSAEELIDLEQARLTLRGEHGMAVDRGRIVREALAVVLADLDAKGDASILVRRLRGR
ncbi:MAG: cobyrinic acid a,c-diamide synthase [Frankiaceae bacterium]|nr:cobyrinic acid a,c-diamide synthase [Frankiaceae bacterium]